MEFSAAAGVELARILRHSSLHYSSFILAGGRERSIGGSRQLTEMGRIFFGKALLGKVALVARRIRPEGELRRWAAREKQPRGELNRNGVLGYGD
jgi:hypothetical protein